MAIDDYIKTPERPNRINDISGQKFGRLTVIRFACIKDRRAYFDCLCDCGNTVIACGKDVRQGNTRSCGCLRAEITPTKKVFFNQGDKYGFLTVIKEITPKISPSGRKNRIIECSCVCGRFTQPHADSLVRGVIKSCGCIRKPSKRKLDIKPGDKFGMLTVISEVANHRNSAGIIRRRFKFLCDCGAEHEADITAVIHGKTISCGCLQSNIIGAIARIHGESKKSVYRIWCKIKERCLSETCKSFHRYGGRGITICDGWRDDVVAFINDMGERPSPEHSVDRIDNDGHYSCGKCKQCKENDWHFNCRWATAREQNNNTRQNVKVTFNGKDMTIAQLARLSCLGYVTVQSRIKYLGWCPECAISNDLRKGCIHKATQLHPQEL